MEVKDYVREQKDLYMPKSEPVIIEVPEMLFLMVDGSGAPDPEEGTPEHQSEFQQAFTALYGVVYSIKMAYKGDEQPPGYFNFKVPPPEGLWWMGDGTDFDMSKRGNWRWTLMIRVPEFVTPDLVQKYVEQLVSKKKDEVYRKVRVEPYHEGLSVQLMHVGPYADEGPNIQKMHQFALDQGYKLHGKHHEIYYGDPRRSAPEKLRTILRQPIAR
ncbi:MAG: GyrI-like domain-containing protein [Candidatus Saccharimonadales bacterium]